MIKIPEFSCVRVIYLCPHKKEILKNNLFYTIQGNIFQLTNIYCVAIIKPNAISCPSRSFKKKRINAVMKGYLCAGYSGGGSIRL